MGYATLMLSNNKEPRVKMFCDAVGTDYIYKAGKPAQKNYKKAMQHTGAGMRAQLPDEFHSASSYIVSIVIDFLFFFSYK